MAGGVFFLFLFTFKLIYFQVNRSISLYCILLSSALFPHSLEVTSSLIAVHILQLNFRIESSEHLKQSVLFKIVHRFILSRSIIQCRQQTLRHSHQIFVDHIIFSLSDGLTIMSNTLLIAYYYKRCFHLL
mgnify:FL=1